MGRIAVAFIVASAVAGPVTPATRPPQQDSFLATFESEGTVPCSVFNAANATRRATYEWWLLGFVSGAGFARSNLMLSTTKVDAKGATEWVTKYCAQRPKETLGAAAGALVAILSPVK